MLLALFVASAVWLGPIGPVRAGARMNAELDEPERLPEMVATAARLARRGCGLLATDESVPTAGKRLETIGVANTEDNRRAFRELLYTTEGLGEHISGVIMFDEVSCPTIESAPPVHPALMLP